MLLLAAWLVPPLAPLARRYEFVEALQFVTFAVAVPALVVIGAPWRFLGLASREPRSFDDDGRLVPSETPPGVVDRLAEARPHHPEPLRSCVFAALYLGGAIIWRTPLGVDAVARHGWLAGVEALTLLVAGAGLWLELVESPPLTPRLSRPHRVALAAISMWIVWILAYVVGLSHASWYPAYVHHAGTGLSVSADQQLTTGAMWLVSGCAFVPVVFSNLFRWLQSEEDPDQMLHQLVRQERRRGRALHPGQPGR